ncbi:phosphatidylserine decarboxylase [Arcobacter arenosus]|uniref:phosphatidylserine decarboxylase n=1 Tax=Arcobacter arenosus TaxID=2576037 RepID=UPI003BA9D716
MFDNMIAKEGYQKILVAFIAFLFFTILECGLLAFISFASFIFFIYAYRYKYIDLNTLEKNKIYAPISGKISAIDVKDFKKIIYIDVSLCDSHILRSLDSGLTKTQIRYGLNLVLSSLKAKKLNSQAIFEYKDTRMQIVSSLFNDSIEIEKKDEFIKGEKIGTFLNGQVIITLDESYETDLKIGQKVESGITILAIK